VELHACGQCSTDEPTNLRQVSGHRGQPWFLFGRQFRLRACREDPTDGGVDGCGEEVSRTRFSHLPAKTESALVSARGWVSGRAAVMVGIQGIRADDSTAVESVGADDIDRPVCADQRTPVVRR